MSPQPKTQPETAEEVASERQTPEPSEKAQPFTVEDLCARGHVLLGGGITLPDVRAALGSLPKTRELSIKDARARVNEWLRAPVSTEPPIEG